jgi:glutamyl-tRNA synthetase
MSKTEGPHVRFAPSPTGALHIGGARTALYNWLEARHSGGTMALRIEDTDLERSTPENTEQILDALRWLELDWDEGPVSQVGRADSHRAALERLLEAGIAYRDPATADDVKAWKAEHGTGRGYRGPLAGGDGAGGGAIRLRVPDEGETVVEDLIRGPVRFPNSAIDDFVIARADGSVLYNFAVAVDDAEMGIDLVIRGDDHLSNTPKQLLVFEALGYAVPRYAHLPLLHGPDGKKLSKRHGAASVQELRSAGFLPAAVRNYIALLGWGTDDDTTLMSTEELIRRFSVADVNKAAAIFDEKKLRWINGRFMRELEIGEYTRLVAEHLARELDPEEGPAPAADDPRLLAACRAAQEKAQTLAEVWPLIRFAFRPPLDDEKAWQKVMKEEAPELLAQAREALAGIDAFDAAAIEAALSKVLERTGAKPGKVYQPIRVALTGSTVSPGIFETLELMGQEESLRRIDQALQRLAG